MSEVVVSYRCPVAIHVETDDGSVTRVVVHDQEVEIENETDP
jgi:hypothetical protein